MVLMSIRSFGYILENHRLQVGFVSIQEELPLDVDNRLHSYDEGMLSLPDSLDESLCLIHLFLGVEQGFLVGSAHLVLVIAVLLYHIGEGWGYGEFRNVTAVQAEGDGAVVVGIYDEVGVICWMFLPSVSPIEAPGFGFSFLISRCRVSSWVSLSSNPALILSQCFLVNSSK